MQTLRIFEIKPGDQKGQLKVTESDAMLSDILAKYLELDKVTLIKCCLLYTSLSLCDQSRAELCLRNSFPERFR